MGLTDEWWEELEANPDLETFIIDLAQETLEVVDPAPGLELYLRRNGLGVIPIDRDKFEDKEEMSHPQLTPPAPNFIHTEDTPKVGLYDYVMYETKPNSRGVVKAGRGILKKSFGPTSFEVSNGDIIDILEDKVTLIRKFGD